jgi:hypothetical protein
MKDVQTMPGADIDFDHNLLVVKICTRLKKIMKFQKGKPRWNMEKLYICSMTESARYSRRKARCNRM